MLSEHLIDYATRAFIKVYRRHPVLTVIITSVLVVTVSILAYLDSQKRQKGFEELRAQNLDFNNQLTQMENAESILKRLLVFVQNQRDQLKESQTRIEELKKEHEKIKPLIKADRQILESFFWAQEKRQRTNIWKERWIGFVFGILASLIASIGWYFIVQLIKKSRAGK
jgi:hypothetical protein